MAAFIPDDETLDIESDKDHDMPLQIKLSSEEALGL